MKLVQNLVAVILALAIANYGVVATAMAHAHDDHGFHQVHVVNFDGSDHDHGHDAPISEHPAPDFDEGAPTSDHSETGFHSHSTPQFGPADTSMWLDFALIPKRALPPDPQGVAPRYREKPPFKPPRTSL